MPKGSWLKLIIIATIVISLTLLAKVLPLHDYTVALVEELQNFGVLGLVLLAAVYVVACICFVPGSILTLGAGFLAATLWPTSLLKALMFGTLTVSAGSVIGATVCFLLGRTLLRDWVATKVAAYPRFQAVDEAVGKNGRKMVFLLRLSPVFPFNLLNYGLGITKVHLLDYILASWIGMLPGTVMYVYLGTAGGGLLASTTGESAPALGQQVLFGIGLVATIAVAVLVTLTAKRALAESTGNTHTKEKDA